MRENNNYFKKSISKYLTISLILLIFIIICGILSFQYYKSLDDIYNKLDNDGNDHIRKLSEVSAKAIWDIDQGAIDSIGGVFLANENVNSVKISAETVLFYGNKDEKNKDLIIKEKEVMYQGKKIGKVEISINKKKYQENINNLFFSNMQLLLLVILTLSLVTSFLVKYFLSKPLGNLKEEISNVKRGEYTTNGISEEYAEFTDIIKNFKDMAEIIKNREEELIESNRKIEEAAKEKSEILLNMNAELEKKVNERTIELKKSMEDLKEAQQRIIEVEKMASLGTLVAGVAHEVNTPLGVCLTASSYLQEKTESFKKEYEKENISRDDLEEYISTAYESTDLIMKNIERADELIHSFKQIAVDQSTEEKREFNLKGYIDSILKSLHPKWKKTKHTVIINCDDIEILSYPGVFHQIISNLITNSLIHGFEGIEKGEMKINVQKSEHELCLIYSDDGKGMPEEDLKKIYEPFFTTKRGHGGTGLGMNIVYNLVTMKLGGSIIAKSELGKGLFIEIRIPI